MPRVPRRTQRNVGVRMLIKLFDGDTVKADELRARIVNKGMVRRDVRGAKVVDSVVKRDRGKPPRVPKRPDVMPRQPQARPPGDVEKRRADFRAKMEAEIAARGDKP